MTDWRTLRQGDVVVVESCRACGKHHSHVLGERPRPGVFFTTGTYHRSTTGTLNVAVPAQEGRLKLAPPGARIEDVMRGDLPGGYP